MKPQFQKAALPNTPVITWLLVLSSLATTVFSMPVARAETTGMHPGSPPCEITGQQNVIRSPLLSVLTLNLAHGRKDSLNQMLQRTSTTRRNLEQVANFLSNSNADLVALQEADHASRWSGQFNHVEYVSSKTPYPCKIHASHAQKYMYNFGTALLSRVPFNNSILHTFEPSPPTTNKGFVMGEVLWNPDGRLPEAIPVSVISVHLDFSRKKVRKAQTEEMRTILKDIARPVIILGDFNTDWSKDESSLRSIAESGQLKVYQAESRELGTYKNGKHRLDWILISNELEFVSYEALEVVLSDHQPVFATLKLLENSTGEKDSSATVLDPDNQYE